MASLLIARHSRSRSRFDIALCFTAFTLTVAFWHRSLLHGVLAHGRVFGIALYITLFSHMVAFWHRSLLYGVLAHGRVFGITLYFTVFTLTVAFWHRSLLHGILAHGRVLALLCISQCSRTWSYFVALSISHCFCGQSGFRTDFSSIKYSFYLVLFRNSIPSDFSFLVSF